MIHPVLLAFLQYMEHGKGQTGAYMPVCCFSGTGQTRQVAEALTRELALRGQQSRLFALPVKEPLEDFDVADFLVLLSPVHGFDLPDLVVRFASSLPDGKGRRAAIILTAGDGEHPSNGSAAGRLVARLKRRGWKPDYLRIFTMGSNFLFRYPDYVVRRLHRAMLLKIPDTVDGILSGQQRSVRTLFAMRLIAPLLHFGEEQIGARIFGLTLHAGRECTCCGLCVSSCPAGNIRLSGNRIRFGFRCLFCMKCVNLCPSGAIRSVLFPFLHFRNPYRPDRIIEGDVMTGTDEHWNGELAKRKNYLERPET